MSANNRWVYRDDKTPRVYTTPVKNPRKKIGHEHGKHAYIYVESMYTDKKLGLNKRKGYTQR